MLRIATTAVGATLLASAAAAQITVIATDSFEYPTPGLIQNAGGGTGWASAWDQPNGNGNEIVLFDQNVMPVMTCADMSGAYVGQATEFVAAQRIPDQFGHGDVTDGGYFGADGSTIWISFRTQMYQQFGMGSFGAVQLWDTNNQAEERMLLGSPWGTSALGMGLGPGRRQRPSARVPRRLRRLRMCEARLPHRPHARRRAHPHVGRPGHGLPDDPG